MVDFPGGQVHAEHLLTIDVDDDTVVTKHFGQEIGAVGRARDVKFAAKIMSGDARDIAGTDLRCLIGFAVAELRRFQRPTAIRESSRFPRRTWRVCVVPVAPQGFAGDERGGGRWICGSG